jgi:hypothetical protein
MIQVGYDAVSLREPLDDYGTTFFWKVGKATNDTSHIPENVSPQQHGHEKLISHKYKFGEHLKKVFWLALLRFSLLRSSHDSHGGVLDSNALFI